jgi:hypothetical protein
VVAKRFSKIMGRIGSVDDTRASERNRALPVAQTRTAHIGVMPR